MLLGLHCKCETSQQTLVDLSSTRDSSECRLGVHGLSGSNPELNLNKNSQQPFVAGFTKEKTMTTEGYNEFSALPDGVQHDFEHIENEIIITHSRWDEFRSLYIDNELRVELINSVAPGFFCNIQVVQYESVILGICRITDNESTNRNKNLTLRGLVRKISEKHYELREHLDDELHKLDKTLENMRFLRHKKIAHLDSIAVSDPDFHTTYGICGEDVDTALKHASNIMKAVRKYFEMPDCEYSVTDPKGVKTLLTSLVRADEFYKLEKESPELRTGLTRNKFWEV